MLDAAPTRDPDPSWTAATVRLEAGSVSVGKRVDDNELRFLRGARATAEGNRLVVRFAPGQWTGEIKRAAFSWTAQVVREHPYASTIEDVTKSVRHPAASHGK